MEYLSDERVKLDQPDAGDLRFFMVKRGSHIEICLLLADGRCVGYETTELELKSARKSRESMTGMEYIESTISDQLRYPGLRPCRWLGPLPGLFLEAGDIRCATFDGPWGPVILEGEELQKWIRMLLEMAQRSGWPVEQVGLNYEELLRRASSAKVETTPA